MAYNRANIRTEVRDAFYEPVADLISDNQLNKFLAQEIRSLPRKGIYLEEYETATVDQNHSDYGLNSNVYKVDAVEANVGTADLPQWSPLKGWEQFGDAIRLATYPSGFDTIRIKVRKNFTVLTDDTTVSDIPDDVMEVVIWGTVKRAYMSLMGYFKDAKNWDAIAKPDGISMYQIIAWYKEAANEYKELLKLYRKTPTAHDIDLVG